MKLERIKDMPQLKREIISYLFDFVTRKQWGEWWQYKGEFNYEDKAYELECKVKFDNQMFTYRDLHIEHKQIEVTMEDMVKQGIVSADEVEGLMQ
jgi:hypothetical protein